MVKRNYNYEKSLHYYTESSRYEQSFDIYHPRIIMSSDKDEPNHQQQQDNTKPIIVLVMGSGWIGHARWIYFMTGLWNAQLPKAICKRLGYTCITIRHSGGFFHWKALTLSMLCLWMIQPTYYEYWLLGWFLLSCQGKDAATMDDMLQDVENAMDFIHNNTQCLGLEKNNDTETTFIVGGYSSGAHLAATYLNQLKKFKRKQEERIVGVLFLSGVLSLKCWEMNLLCQTVFGVFSNTLPSPLEMLSSSSENPKKNKNSSTLLPMICNLPHLLIGCRHEVFGLPILDHAFCSTEYCQRLKMANKLSRCVLIQGWNSNHWTILSSFGLTQALEENLPLMFSHETQNRPVRSKNIDCWPDESVSTTTSSDITSFDSDDK